MFNPELRVVYVQYGNEHFQEGTARLGKLLNEWFPRHTRRICVVDNAIEGNLEVCLAADMDFISGNNVMRDFSGYDRGIEWLRSAHPTQRPAFWVFANDTFHRDLGVPTSRYFTKEAVYSGVQKNAFVGYEDRYPQAIQLFGLPLQRWIRTNFFVLPDAVLQKVGALAMPFSDSEIFGGTVRSFFKTPSPLSQNYREFLQTWLFGRRDPKGEFRSVWRSAEKLTSENLKEFEVKTKAILSEHFLSARIQSCGVKIFPVNSPMLSMFLSKEPNAMTRMLQSPGANSKSEDPQKRRYSSERLS